MNLINKLLKVNKKGHIIGTYKHNNKLPIDGKEYSIKTNSESVRAKCQGKGP
jgi:hypothetical protein